MIRPSIKFPLETLMPGQPRGPARGNSGSHPEEQETPPPLENPNSPKPGCEVSATICNPSCPRSGAPVSRQCTLPPQPLPLRTSVHAQSAFPRAPEKHVLPLHGPFRNRLVGSRRKGTPHRQQRVSPGIFSHAPASPLLAAPDSEGANPTRDAPLSPTCPVRHFACATRCFGLTRAPALSRHLAGTGSGLSTHFRLQSRQAARRRGGARRIIENIFQRPVSGGGGGK